MGTRPSVGWYVRYPATGLNAIQAPFGFAHMAPYRTSSTYITDEATKAAMLADLDRYAACGLRVHYDLRGIARMDNGPDKERSSGPRSRPCGIIPPSLVPRRRTGTAEDPPANLDAAYQLVKSLDPYHPCTQVFARRTRRGGLSQRPRPADGPTVPDPERAGHRRG
ncbi:MAG: hypothetical protein M5U09_25320 [Gammaproteobacteria bacterium]|nr:hypothetical protein [Gammaproteobacteria bacterium]